MMRIAGARSAEQPGIMGSKRLLTPTSRNRYMKMGKGRGFRTTAIFLLSALVLSGCGAGTKKAKDSAPLMPALDTNKDTGPVKIGLIAIVTGEKEEFGKSLWVSAEMAAEKINEEGGVLGRQIELVKRDSQGESKKAVEIAREMAADEEITAVIGPMMSGEAIACAPIFEEAGMIELAPLANHPDYALMGAHMFTLAASQTAEFPPIVEKQVKGFHKAKRVGVMYTSTEWGVSSLNEFEAACKEGGVDIVCIESIPGQEADFTSSIMKVRQTNPELLMIISHQIECAALLRQLKETGWEIPVAVSSTNYSDQVLQLAGDAAEGITSITAFFLSEEDGETWQYAQEFEKRTGYMPTVHGAFSYDAVGILCDGIRRAGSTDREAVFQALKATDHYEGIAGSCKFTQDGYVDRDFQVVQVEKGKWVLRTIPE